MAEESFADVAEKIEYYLHTHGKEALKADALFEFFEPDIRNGWDWVVSEFIGPHILDLIPSEHRKVTRVVFRGIGRLNRKIGDGPNSEIWGQVFVDYPTQSIGNYLAGKLGIANLDPKNLSLAAKNLRAALIELFDEADEETKKALLASLEKKNLEQMISKAFYKAQSEGKGKKKSPDADQQSARIVLPKTDYRAQAKEDSAAIYQRIKEKTKKDKKEEK